MGYVESAPPVERPAIQRQGIRSAERRLVELRAVARTLWPDRDDPEVMSELVSLMAQIREAEEALRDG